MTLSLWPFPTQLAIIGATASQSDHNYYQRYRCCHHDCFRVCIQRDHQHQGRGNHKYVYTTFSLIIVCLLWLNYTCDYYRLHLCHNCVCLCWRFMCRRHTGYTAMGELPPHSHRRRAHCRLLYKTYKTLGRGTKENYKDTWMKLDTHLRRSYRDLVSYNGSICHRYLAHNLIHTLGHYLIH